MKIVVVGGTGRIGSQVVANLGEERHETITGEGLREVLRSCDVVIDVSDPPSFDEAAVVDFFRTSTGNLLAAERRRPASGTTSRSRWSGIECMADKAYFKAKSVQES